MEYAGDVHHLKLEPPKIRKWTQLARERVGHFRILDVCRIELQDGAGRLRGDAFTLHCPDWCNIVAVTPEDEVVFVWQYRFGTDSLSLEIPGGVIDPGETPPDAARRELLEETGYEGETLSPLLVVEPNPAMMNNRCFSFVAHTARRKQAPRFDPLEELETVLVPSRHLIELLDSGKITHCLVQGAIETYCRRRNLR